MKPMPGLVTITQQAVVDFGSTAVGFKYDEDITAQVERMDYETLLNLWNARGEEHGLTDTNDEAFLAALTLRLIRGKSIGSLVGKTGARLVLFDHYANR